MDDWLRGVAGAAELSRALLVYFLEWAWFEGWEFAV